MIGHHAISHNFQLLMQQVLAHQAQEVKIVFLFKENGIEIIPSVINVIVFAGYETNAAIRYLCAPVSYGPVSSKETGSMVTPILSISFINRTGSTRCPIIQTPGLRAEPSRYCFNAATTGMAVNS